MADIEPALHTSDPSDPTHPQPTVSEGNDVIVIQRATLYNALFALTLLLFAFALGWLVGKSSGATGAAMQTAVLEAASTTVASTSANSSLGTNSSQPAAVQVSTQRFAVTVGDAPVIGPENAAVTIIEFGDFQCPFCKHFHDQTLSALLKQYEGKIRFAYRNFPIRAIHAYAQSAAEAASCASDQQKSWEYHDLLFQNVQRLTKTDLLAYATQLNLDTKVFQSCLETGKHNKHVQDDYQAGLALGISGTPTFFVNGRMLIGSQPLSVFSAVIDAELAASQSAAGGPP